MKFVDLKFKLFQIAFGTQKLAKFNGKINSKRFLSHCHNFDFICAFGPKEKFKAQILYTTVTILKLSEKKRFKYAKSQQLLEYVF